MHVVMSVVLDTKILDWVTITSPTDLPHPGMELMSLMSSALAGRFFTTSTTWEAQDSVLKCRDITLPTKAHTVKDMDFLVVMYGCGSWTTEHQEIDAF